MEFKFKYIHIGNLINQLVNERQLNTERILNFLKISDE